MKKWSWSRRLAGFVVTILLAQSCLEPELEPLNFFQVSTEAATTELNGLVGNVIFNGRLSFESEGPAVLDDYGFYWSEDRMELEVEGPQRQFISLGAFSSGNLDFAQAGPQAELNKTYYFQAYAVAGAREMLGEIRQYRLDIEMQLNVLERLNDRIRFSASIGNLSELGLAVDNFGLLIEKDNPDPSRESADIIINFGEQIDNFNADTLVGSFMFNSTYYARPFYQGAQLEPGDVIEVQVTDGWTQGPFMPQSLYNTTAVTFEGNAYLFGGETTQSGFPVTDILRYNLSLNERWEVVGDVVPPQSFSEGISVVWDGQPHYGYANAVPDWFALDASAPINLCMPDDRPQIANSVAFTNAGQLYFGTGRNVQSGEVFDQFWELRNGSGCVELRELAPMPVRAFGSEVDEPGFGREGAVNFTIGGEIYVGGGSSGPIEYKDLYRFVPPVDGNDLGSWEFVTFLPDAAREDALVVVIDDRAFYGFGFNPGIGFLGDWWEFAPGSVPAWIERQACPGGVRAQAAGFAIGENGYVAGGFRLLTEGVSFPVEVLQDTWIYTPANND